MARRFLLRPRPRLCHAAFLAFILRSFLRRACLNFGRLLRDFLERAMAGLYTRRGTCNQGPGPSYTHLWAHGRSQGADGALCGWRCPRLPRALRPGRAALAWIPDEDGEEPCTRRRPGAADLLQGPSRAVRLRARRRPGALDLRDRPSHVHRRGPQEAARGRQRRRRRCHPRGRGRHHRRGRRRARGSRRPRADARGAAGTRGPADRPARGGRADQARRQERRRGRRDRRHDRRRDEGSRASRLRGAAQAARRKARRGMSDVVDALGSARPPKAPPLSAALEAELGKLTAVKPRRPMRELAVMLGVSLVYGAGLVAMFAVRGDLHELPMPWLLAAGLAWLLGFVVPCYLALVPPRAP